MELVTFKTFLPSVPYKVGSTVKISKYAHARLANIDEKEKDSFVRRPIGVADYPQF
jgi:hypothetical protein